MSHMTKEERKANNIRNETQRRINAGDTSSYVQSQISSNPNTFTNVQPNQRQEQQQDIYKQAADTMKQAGITGVGDINKNKRDLANAGGFSDYVITDTTPKTEEKKQPLIDQFDNFMTSFGNVKFPTLPTPLGFGIEALKSFDSTNRFFKNLNTKKSGSLSNQDKITLINLVKAGGEGSGLQYLEKWANDNDLSEEETRDLANKFTGEYSNIGSSIFNSGIMEYLDTKPEGFKDSVAAMLGQYRDEDNPGPNLEYVTDNLGTVGLEYLKATNPAAYYALRPAATSGQMEELAGMALTGNKDFDNKIFAAREAAREKNNQGGGGSGIMRTQMAQQTGTTNPGYDMSIYGSRIGQKGPFTADFVDQDGDGSDDRYQSGPGQGGSGNEKLADLTPTPTGVASLTPTSLDYASMAPQFSSAMGPQYVNQGINDPRFASYFQNLQMFPRRS